MSTFQCPVVRVSIEPHPNADAIELARVGGYVSIVKKGQFKDGDLAVYIPEQAVLPEWLLKDLGFWDDMNGKGTLSSSKGNRVRAIKLRGVLSQGLLYPTMPYNDTEVLVASEPYEGNQGAAIVKIDGGDAAECMGIVKWEPVIPAHLAGKVAGGDLDATIGFDFENLKKHPDLFEDGEEVVFTEKLHGTLLQVGIIPRRLWEGKSWAEKCPDIGEHGFKGIVTSKGQGARGLMIDPSDAGNLYVQVATEQKLWDKLEQMRTDVLGHPSDMPLFLFGEIFGEGVQDLTYGQSGKKFRAFDIYAGVRDNGFYLVHDLFVRCLSIADVPMVPQLYRGPFSHEAVSLHTNGNTTITATTRAVIQQIREGIVVKATSGMRHPRLGRKIAKSVSEAYLLRKGNVTEFQ